MCSQRFQRATLLVGVAHKEVHPLRRIRADGFASVLAHDGVQRRLNLHCGQLPVSGVFLPLRLALAFEHSQLVHSHPIARVTWQFNFFDSPHLAVQDDQVGANDIEQALPLFIGALKDGEQHDPDGGGERDGSGNGGL